MKKTKNASYLVRMTSMVLTGLAVWFAQMPCIGRLHEPQMPEQLKKEINK